MRNCDSETRTKRHPRKKEVADRESRQCNRFPMSVQGWSSSSCCLVSWSACRSNTSRLILVNCPQVLPFCIYSLWQVTVYETREKGTRNVTTRKQRRLFLSSDDNHMSQSLPSCTHFGVFFYYVFCKNFFRKFKEKLGKFQEISGNFGNSETISKKFG